MKLEYWNGQNFGDQLNNYIFPRLAPELLKDASDDILFYGIGSIIYHKIPTDQRLVIFGTGVRDPLYKEDMSQWDVRFLRGPLSAKCLALPDRYITDAAYCLALLDNFEDLANKAKKTHRASVIPYFPYAPLLPWKKICDQVGINYIDPAGPPELIVKEILSSERVIAGAMHGAIVADICRVPWIRLKMDQYPKESPFLTEFKWADWMFSLNLNNDLYFKLASFDLQKERGWPSRILFYLESILKLRDRTKMWYQLSEDRVFSSAIERLKLATVELHRDYVLNNR